MTFNGESSEKAHMDVGVQQGSILGSLLCLIHLNDLPLECQHSILDMYADDSTLTVSHKNLEEVENQLKSGGSYPELV